MSRRRMVFAATGRRRGLVGPGRKIAAAEESSIVARMSFSAGEEDPSVNANCGSGSLPPSASIIASLCAEAGLDRVRIFDGQRVLGREVVVRPVGGFIGGLKPDEVGKQAVAQSR